MVRQLIQLAAVLPLISACAPMKMHAYEGQPRPPEELATVKCSPNIVINAIDGNAAWKAKAGRWGTAYVGCDISVLPGRRTFDVCFDAAGSIGSVTCRKDIPLEFQASEGRTYKISYETVGYQWRPVVADVTEQESRK